MDKSRDFELLARLLVPLILIPLLGLSARPHRVASIMAWAGDAAHGKNPLALAGIMAEAAERLAWRPDLWESAGIFALQGSDPVTARDYFHRSAGLGGLSPLGQLLLGDAAYELGDIPAAISSWEAALQAGSRPQDLHERLALAHRRQGDYPAAMAALQQVVGLNPNSAQAHYRIGLMLATRQPEAALAYLTRAAELDDSLAQNSQLIVQSARSARLADEPGYSLVVSGRALATLGEWELAAEAFQQAVQIRPDYAEAWAFLGEARQQLGDSGLPELDTALSLDPGSLAANTLLALYWQRQGRYDLALVYLHAAADGAPDNPTLQAELGNTVANLGNLARAQIYYQRATELAPRDPAFWRLLANFSLKYELQLREVALPAARQAVLLDPEDPASLDVLGQVYILLDDPLSAERMLLRALQFDPGYAAARLHLGFLYLMQGKSQAAREELQIARSLAGQEPAVADQAGRLLQSYFP